MAIVKELALGGKNWAEIRTTLTDEQIKRIYGLYAALWPRETDLLHLLPKPDGAVRAVYTGCIHPTAITEFAVGASLYFGELLIEHPFVHAGAVNKAFSPVENPRAYRQEFLKCVIFLAKIMPLVDAGLVNLVPDPCNFDLHLRDQMYSMAQVRMRGVKWDANKDPRMRDLMEEDAKRGMLALPPDALRSQVRRSDPDMDAERMEEFIQGVEHLKRADPLAVLQEGSFEGGKDGGLLSMCKLSPNFEMAMYLAQVVGGSIVTDSLHRWEEIQRTIRWRPPRPSLTLRPFAKAVASADFAFVQTADNILNMDAADLRSGYSAVMKEAFRYASRIGKTGEKANLEASIAARFVRVHTAAQAAIAKEGVEFTQGRVSCAFPWGGFQDNTINRLLLMSSSDHHLPNVPMAFYISRLGQ